LLLGSLAWVGCGKRAHSTPELIADLKSPEEKDRIVAVRLLPQRKGDAAQVVPALIEALKDKVNDVRWRRRHRPRQFGRECEGGHPRAEGGPARPRCPGPRSGRVAIFAD